MISIIIMLALALGSLNPAVTQDNIATTICQHGWTATVRPPRAYTYNLKRRQMRALGITGSSRPFEEDHIVPLELGGNPTDPNNLRPQRWTGAHGARAKDKVENALNRAVCSGRTPLSDARARVVVGWIYATRKAVATKGGTP